MAEKELRGKIVMTVYNKRMYRIDGIDFGKTPLSTFYHSRDERHVTFAQYYGDRYGAYITDPQQCLLYASSRRGRGCGPDNQPVYLLPQLCSMTGLTEDMRLVRSTGRQQVWP